MANPLPTAEPRATDPDAFHLRPVRAQDAEAILAAFESNPDMARQGEVTSLVQAKAYAEWLLLDAQRSLAIADATDTLVGLVAITVDEPNRVGWFFYWMHEDVRGHGISQRAAATVAEHALAPSEDGGWGLERLELGHRANNPASEAVALAAGFVHEGTERQKFLIDGERHDVLTYGRLRSDPSPSTPRLRLEHANETAG